jgi:hypothetical protein
MRRRCLSVGVLVLSCVLAGCGEGVSPGVATPDNPQVGIDKANELSKDFMDLQKTVARDNKSPKK